MYLECGFYHEVYRQKGAVFVRNNSVDMFNVNKHEIFYDFAVFVKLSRAVVCEFSF